MTTTMPSKGGIDQQHHELQQQPAQSRRRIWLELQTRDARIRTCVILLTVLGVPAFMIWWQVTAMPLREAGSALILEEEDMEVAEITKVHEGEEDSSAGLEVASDVAPSTMNTDHTKTQSRPQMVWLMSFPNSGTSYTMRMVRSASNRAIATNYGPEVSSAKHPVSIPLYPPLDSEKEVVTGPFWRGSKDDKLYRPLPDRYVITKTHCGGRCVRCTPSRYVLTLPQFLRACTQGEGCFPSENTKETNNNTTTSPIHCEYQDTHYPPPPHNPHLGKLIHLIRNPFDNIVSRYHLSRKQWLQRLEDTPDELQEWLQRHPNNATGFHRWCEELDADYGSPFAAKNSHNNSHHQVVSTELFCQGEWFRYLQWHTLALDTLELSNLPSLTIYYEDYNDNWNATVEQILDFVEVPRPLEDEAAVREFVSRPPYDYYTHQQRKQARSLVKQTVSDKVWQLLKRYF